MISTLHGTLFEKDPNGVVIECCGVGYEAAVPISTYGELPRVGEECRLFTRHVVREDSEQLYGFATKGERDVFDMLMNVSGVGPKLAICVLSGMMVDEFKKAVSGGDVKRISSVKGIGKKTAERIIVELKGRIDPVEAMALTAGEKKDGGVVRDAVMALVTLGYSQDQAGAMVRAALDSGADSGDAQQLVRKAISSR